MIAALIDTVHVMSPTKLVTVTANLFGSRPRCVLKGSEEYEIADWNPIQCISLCALLSSPNHSSHCTEHVLHQLKTDDS
jgi:hypothetical protein